MTPKRGRMRRVGRWLGVVCLGLFAASSGLAQEFKLRRSLWLEGIQARPPVAFSPDGKLLVSVGMDHKSLKLWDVTTSENLATLNGHTGKVISVAFSPDGKTLASGDVPSDARRILAGKIMMWDVATGKNTLALEGHTAPVILLAFRPDGKTLASASWDGRIRFWEVAGGKNIASCEGLDFHDQIVAFSPDGKLLASANLLKVQLRDVASGKVIATFEERDIGAGGIESLVFSPDGKVLACGGNRGVFFFTPPKPHWITLWNVAGGKKTATIPNVQEAQSMAFSPDGKMLASWGDSFGTAELWDATTGKNTTPRVLFDWNRSVSSLAFSPDGKTLALASAEGCVKLFNVAGGKNEAAPGEHGGAVYAVAFSPDGKTLASGSRDQTVKLWNVSTGRNTATFQGHRDFVASVAFSPDNKTLASGSADRTIRIWDVSSGKPTALLRGHTQPVTSVAFSPDGKILASGSPEGTKLWDVATGMNTATLPTEWRVFVWSVAFSPDGKTLATGNGDGTVELWDVTRRERRAILDGRHNSVNSVAFSPDGKTLAAGSGVAFFHGPWAAPDELQPGRTTLWDVAGGRILATLKDEDGPVYSVAFSRDGRTLLSRGKLWDVSRGRIITGPGAGAMSGTFSPDGKVLALGMERTIQFWDILPTGRAKK